MIQPIVNKPPHAKINCSVGTQFAPNSGAVHRRSGRSMKTDRTNSAAQPTIKERAAISKPYCNRSPCVWHTHCDMTTADFRRLALSLPGAEEGSHMGSVDFRVGGRIFATLAAVKQGYGNLMFSLELQAEFMQENSDVFLPVPGGWGRNGATHMRLSKASEDLAARALHAAWKLRSEKNVRPVKKSARNKFPQVP